MNQADGGVTTGDLDDAIRAGRRIAREMLDVQVAEALQLVRPRWEQDDAIDEVMGNFVELIVLASAHTCRR